MIVALVAHPVLGVKVYVVVPTVEVFIVDGLHVPRTPLLDVVCSGGAVEPWHNIPIGLKVGVSDVVTTTFITALIAQGTDGVKV